VDKFGYKALSVRGDRLMSLYSGDLGRDAVEYKLGKVVRPKVKDSPLFVFGTLQDAIAATPSTAIIFKVAYKESRKRPESHHGLKIRNTSLFADELCLLYPVWKGEDSEAKFEVQQEGKEDSGDSVRKVIVI